MALWLLHLCNCLPLTISFPEHKSTQRGKLGAKISFQHISAHVRRLKYYTYTLCVSAIPTMRLLLTL